jgi:hypothetical protein
MIIPHCPLCFVSYSLSPFVYLLGIDPDEVLAAIKEIKGVVEVHDLHIWSLTVGKPSLSCHISVHDDSERMCFCAPPFVLLPSAFAHRFFRLLPRVGVLQMVVERLGTDFNLHHTTIQMEKTSLSCPQR